MKLRVLGVLAAVGLVGADAPEKAVPPLNQKVVAFCEARLGKKVDNGECAMLALRALQKSGAKPSSVSLGREYVWGKLVRTATPGESLTGDVLPGDVLQFRDVVLVQAVEMPGGGRGTVEAFYPQHTAIVALVKADGAVLEVLHQNAGGAGKSDQERRTVQRGTVRLGDLKKGSVKIYRPVP
jgi:hypothetical protein